MGKPEISRAKIVSRLIAEGWISEGGAKHEKFAHPDRPGVKIMVPRHSTLTPGVARNIAKAAQW
jgi:predicted RNA binding protein YcfA (HicA-like mRNA interferase family)